MSPVRIKDHWRELRIFEARTLFAAAAMAVLALALVGRLYLLQVMRHDYQAGAALAIELEHELEHCGCVVAVQIARGFVCQ